MSLRDFLKANKIKGGFEGNSGQLPKQQKRLEELTKDKKKGLEIGFNAGDSAELFLNAGVKHLTSLDIGEHDYYKVGKKYINKTFPKRHRLLIGDSCKTLPKLKGKFDFIFIDGDHSYKGALCDYEKSRRLSNSKTLIIFDDWNPDKNSYQAPKKVINEAVKAGLFKVVGKEKYKTGRGMLWGYNLNL